MVCPDRGPGLANGPLVAAAQFLIMRFVTEQAELVTIEHQRSQHEAAAVATPVGGERSAANDRAITRDAAISAIRLRPANAAPGALLSRGSERVDCLLTLNRDD